MTNPILVFKKVSDMNDGERDEFLARCADPDFLSDKKIIDGEDAFPTPVHIQHLPIWALQPVEEALTMGWPEQDVDKTYNKALGKESRMGFSFFGLAMGMLGTAAYSYIKLSQTYKNHRHDDALGYTKRDMKENAVDLGIGLLAAFGTAYLLKKCVNLGRELSHQSTQVKACLTEKKRQHAAWSQALDLRRYEPNLD